MLQGRGVELSGFIEQEFEFRPKDLIPPLI
jgi:hypothetical protein